jgi:hypothetical protein
LSPSLGYATFVRIRNWRPLALGVVLLGVATALAIYGRWEVAGVWALMAFLWGRLATRSPKTFDKDPESSGPASLLGRWRCR